MTRARTALTRQSGLCQTIVREIEGKRWETSVKCQLQSEELLAKVTQMQSASTAALGGKSLSVDELLYRLAPYCLAPRGM